MREREACVCVYDVLVCKINKSDLCICIKKVNRFSIIPKFSELCVCIISMHKMLYLSDAATKSNAAYVRVNPI